jgi:hypothetical protein
MFLWWRKRKKEVKSVMYYDQNEVLAVFNRLNGCPGCTSWQRDMVMARVGRFLVDTWDGKSPTPPTAQELYEHCCKYDGPRRMRTVTIDTTKLGHATQFQQGEPLP